MRPGPFGAAGLLAALALAGCAAAPGPGAARRGSDDDRVVFMDRGVTQVGERGLFGLDDDEFWTDPLRNQSDATGRLSDDRVVGPRIDGPRRVALAARTTLPIALAYRESHATFARAPLEDWAVVCAIDPRDGWFAARKVATDPLPPQARPDPTAPVSRGYASRCEVFDLRERLGVPWRAGPLLVTVIVRDAASNRLRIEREGGEPAPPAPPLQADAPGDPLPSFAPRPDSPAPPAAGGIVVAAERVCEVARPVVLRGAVRVAAPRTGIADAVTGRADVAREAVVPVVLLLTSSVSRGVVVHRLAVPVARPRGGDAQADGAAWLDGAFALDLRTIPGAPTGAETVFVYAFTGEHMHGPTPVGLVTQAQLRD